MAERLQKYLARCGVASRRKCEELIQAGDVEVDGKLVTKLGTSIEPDLQVVTLRGERVRAAPQVYFALNKPKGVVCTNADPQRRKRAVDCIPTKNIRLFPVGRLDEDSEGLLILTNDGQLTDRVTHPRFEVEKVYQVDVKGQADPEALKKLRQGVWLAEGKTRPAKVAVRRKTRESTTLQITLQEGKNRHLRRVLAKVEIPVRRLRRIKVGPVSLGSLKPGDWRRLSRDEIVALQAGRSTLPRNAKKLPPRVRARKRS